MNINQDEQRKRFPKLTAMRKDVDLKPVLDKLIHDTAAYGYKAGVNRKNQPPAEALIRQVSDDTTQNITDYSNILQLLPDTQLAMQILVSSILSPKDMVNVELGYKVNEHFEETELGGHLLEIIKRHFEEDYKIKSLLPKMLEEILFTKGSYPTLVLPERTIDRVINDEGRVGLEDLRSSGEFDSKLQPVSSLGFLGNPEGKGLSWSLESIGADRSFNKDQSKVPSFKGLGDVTVTDNFDILKLPKLTERLRKNRISDLLGTKRYSAEAHSTKSYKEKATLDAVADAVYQRKNFTFNPYYSLKLENGYVSSGQGHPLVMKLPAEAVIPVYTPSNPEEHVGYFILLDQSGNPLSRVRENDYYKDLNRNIRSKAITSQLLEAGKRAAQGFERNDINLSEHEVVRLYAEIIESDLLKRLRNGIYGESVEIAKPMEVYRVMFSRALANMGTQLLYIPCEIMSYMAFDFNNFGIGKPLLEDNKILAGIRAMLLFSNTMAAIKNSTGKTALRIELDPQDPDPSSTVEYMIHEYSKNRQSGYPLGASNPLDIINFLQKAGIDVQVSGNAAYPETKLDVEQYNLDKTLVDRDLDEDIKKKYFMSLGLSPETIDQTSQIEFATSIVSSNLLLAKRVIIYQDKLLFNVKDFIEKYVKNSGALWTELMECIDSNKKVITSENKKMPHEEILEYFLRSMELHLPRPDSAKLENQMAAYEIYRQALESAMDAYFGQDSFMLREFEDMQENIEAVKAAVISYYLREWLRNNNVLPELLDLVLLNEKGDAALDLNKAHGNHLELIGKSILDLLKRLKKDQLKRQKVLEKIEGNEEEEETSDSNFGGFDSNTTEEEGEDNLDMEEEPEPEPTPAEEEDDLGDSTEEETQAGEEDETAEETPETDEEQNKE